MTINAPVLVFGEVLFDCFPTGEKVLGGAPFNVAWHLQALGDQPHFISAVGDDSLGETILTAMKDWGMKTDWVQTDTEHASGQVKVSIIDGEPHYTITPDCAYDFIAAENMKNLPTKGILYHGSLGLRNSVSLNCLSLLAQQPDISVFLDVNLRSPWWQREEVLNWLKQARWAKLNEDELRQLGFDSSDLVEAMQQLQTEFQLDKLIVTQGAKGVKVLENSGQLYQQTPPEVKHIVDTVGAGDGFSAIFIHGLKAGWRVEEILMLAQKFAAKIIRMRGATATDTGFYREFVS